MNIRDLNAPENELGMFSLWRLAGSDGRQPGFRIGGSNLRIENARHGFVNTPLHKTAVFEDLNVRLYCYSEVERIDGRENVSACVPDDTLVGGDGAAFDTGPVRRDEVGGGSGIGAAVSSMSGANQEVTEPFRQVLSDLQQQFTGGSVCLTIPGPLMDIIRSSKAVVKNLEYGIFYDGQLRLGVKCGRAIISESVSEVCLERGVTLTGEGGQTLVSSRAVWDVKHGLFKIPGPYVLTRDGRLTKGHGMCCDGRFNVQRGKRMAAPKTALFRRVSAAKPAGLPSGDGL